MKSEIQIIKDIRKWCIHRSRDVIEGIGDDTAVIRMGDKNLLVTADMMLEGVHFELSLITPFQLGYKLLAINISDIHAMGGVPSYFFMSLGLPKSTANRFIKELYSGIIKIAERYDIKIVGGDTCRSGSGLVLSGTLIGYGERIIKRSGARVGDMIYVTGTLGDSSAGLYLLKRRKKKIYDFSSGSAEVNLIKRHLLPEPVSISESKGISAMIDISDGLLIDLWRMCDESRVGAVIYKERIPISEELKEISSRFGLDPYSYALKGGEDYVLLFTSPEESRKDAYCIGEIVRRGRYIIDERGKKIRMTPEGYDHFRKNGV